MILVFTRKQIGTCAMTVQMFELCIKITQKILELGQSHKYISLHVEGILLSHLIPVSKILQPISN